MVMSIKSYLGIIHRLGLLAKVVLLASVRLVSGFRDASLRDLEQIDKKPPKCVQTRDPQTRGQIPKRLRQLGLQLLSEGNSC